MRIPFWPDRNDSSDVNVTMLLERSAGESMRAQVLHQRRALVDGGGDALEPARRANSADRLSDDRLSDASLWTPGEEVLHRLVLLRGETSGRAYMHAASTIGVHRLQHTVQRGLLLSDIPFGRLLRDARVYVTRTDLTWIEYDLDDLGALFEHLPRATSGIRRSYVMRREDARAIARIVETFPGGMTR